MRNITGFNKSLIRYTFPPTYFSNEPWIFPYNEAILFRKKEALKILNRRFKWMSTGGEGNGTPLQYSCLENPMDGGAWWAIVHGVTKSRTWLSNFTFTFHFHALEKEMATHSSVLAWRIPGMGQPGGLPSLGSHRVGHDKRLSSSSSININIS